MSPGLQPHFRYAGADDVDAVVALVESAYRGPSGERGWTTESALLGGQRTDPREVALLLQHVDSHILLAECAGRLTASCHVERQGAFGYFGMFAVDPLAQGGGIGRQVLAEAERIARDEWHVAGMRMTVIEQRSELIAWYGRRGYHPNGEFEPFPYGDSRFGLPKRDDLRFEVLMKVFEGGAAWTAGSK